MNARERIYLLGVVGVIGAVVLMRPQVEEPAIEYRYRPPVSRQAPLAAARPNLADVEGMTNCNVRMSDAAQVLFREGDISRWTATSLDARFPVKRATDDPDVRTYGGDAIEFRVDRDIWLQAVYECDFDTESGEVVDVRTQPGQLR